MVWTRSGPPEAAEVINPDNFHYARNPRYMSINTQITHMCALSGRLRCIFDQKDHLERNVFGRLALKM